MHQPHRFIYSSILVIFVASTLYASFVKASSADVASILSSVFKNNSIEEAPEIDQVRAKNLQTMSLLSASLSSLSFASSSELAKDAQRSTLLVEGKALTNENSSVVDGGADSYEKNNGTSDRISIYTVRPGDTLEQVARMYGVSPSTILWANDMKKGSVLKPDQVITILPISGIKYVVKKGDTLASIAKKYKSDVEEMTNFNNLDSDALLALGDEIIIPDAEGEADAVQKSDAKTSSTGSTGTGKKKATGASPKLDDATIGGGPTPYVDTTGYFTRPVVGGKRTQGLHGHNGVDLASSYGSPILAAAAGKVIVVKTGGWDGGYGDYAVIQHGNGTQTLYAHMSAVLVSVGQTVGKGEQIGKMGSTGESTGVHLHFEVRGGKNPF